MLKRLFCCFMCFLFVFYCQLPIFAESKKLDSKLSYVTLKVKQTLNILDDFSNFDSSVDDYILSKMWTLKWSNKDNYINVTCNDDGKIYSYSTSNNKLYPCNNASNFSPIFTKEAFNSSKKAASDFLTKVLDKNESVSFYNSYDKFQTTLPNSYYFNGVIKINELDTPFSFSIVVDSSNFKVTNFHRSGFNISYVNNIPDNSPKISSDDAKSSLTTTCSFKIEYAMDYDKNIARLYYLPSMNQNYYVDAITGKLVNKNNLYSDTTSNNEDDILINTARSDAKNLVDEAIQLTEVELSNIAKLSNVLDKEKIDLVIKSKEELGLSNYSLSTMHYTTVQNSDDIYCNLTYSSSDDFASLGLKTKPKDDSVIYKYIKADAKTGAIISIYTSYPYFYKKDNLNPVLKKDYHKDFLKKYESDYFSKTKLYQKNSSTGNTKRETFVYAQKHKGYFFPNNNLSISINKYTGFVDSFSKTWDNKTKFESSKNIISLKKAKQLYFDDCNIILSYISIPTKITQNADVYKKLGYNHLNQLTLAYTLKNTNNVYRIHARTGKLIGNNIDKNDFVYSDVNVEKDKILALAEHGIGFEHTKFNANKKLTQFEVLVFFVNALGYSFDSSSIDSNSLNNLYSIAYEYNFIAPSEKKPSKLISRSELLKIMLSASEYKSVAKLKDIFRCDFSDSLDINPEFLGYVCIAKSLGLITGDSQNNFRPNDTATRLDAALILYNFMTK